MAQSSHRVQTLIRDVRKRWRRRALLQGFALSAGVLALSGMLLVVAYRIFEPQPTVMFVGAALGTAAVVVVLFIYVIRPATRRISDTEIALYIEEHLPELEDRLNSAVEIEDPLASRRAHGLIVDRLIDDASLRARTIPVAALLDERRERVLAAVSGLAVVAFLVLAGSSVRDLQATLSAADLSSALLASRPSIQVDPGHAEIEQGASQEIVASLRDRSDRDVNLHFRQGDGAWQRVSMQPDFERAEFLHAFTNVQRPIQYFVEHEEQRTSIFEITLYEFPAVEQIDVTYFFPAYTGRTPVTEQGTGDISGVRGTEVQVDVHASGRIDEAVMLISGADQLELEAVGDSLFRGRFRLEQPGYYSVRLTDAAGKQNRFPDEYRISLIEDARPVVAITDPQRDVQANAVQEIVIAAEATDDFGLDGLRLHYAVNAGEERVIPLSETSSPNSTEARGEHVFFLEDYDLQPGDVISYYAEAADHFHEDPTATDMYFIEVIPFDREYRQAGSGAGAGAGAQSGIVLNQQQIIAATWKLYRERGQMSESDYASSLDALTHAQENLRVNIEQRINATAFSLELQRDENNRQLAGHLRSAVEAMREAVIELRADDLQEALVPERRALNFLLRADALNRERQIALSRGQQGGGSASATEERMTELMDLELDISKDKYEMLPQRSGGSPQQEMDETLERLRELARRQENLAGENSRQLEGEDLRRQVERLQRDQEELRRQAETLSRSLSRQSNSSQSEGMQQNLNRAIERMEQAERSLRRGDHREAQAHQQQALNELERMTQRVQARAGGSNREAAERLSREYERLRQEEQQMTQDLDRLTSRSAEGGRPDRAEVEDLFEQRRQALERLQRISESAEQLTNSESAERELSTAATELTRELRREDLEGQMSHSQESMERGWFENAARRQEGIGRSLDRLEEQVRAVESFVPVPEEERLARSLEAVERLERAMRELQDLSRNGAPGAEQPGTDPSGADQPGSDQPGSDQRSTNQTGSDQSDSEQSASNQPGNEQPGSDQPGSDQPGSSSSPSASSGGGQPNSGGVTGRSDREEAALRQARIDRAREALDRLREDLQGSPELGAVNRLHNALGRADHEGVSLVGEAAEAFFNDEVFAPLSQIEESIRQNLDQIAMEKKLFGSRPGDVPPEYRELVDRYYESLSKGRSQ